MRSILLSGKCRKIIPTVTALCLFCTVNLVPVKRANAFSLSEEKELGRKILQLIKAQMPLVEDGEILTYVRSVGNRVAASVGTTTYQYQFFVVDAPVPNAFAVPGGFIFIYRGLIEMMHSEGELASIIGHELGHIQAHHMERRMQEGRLLNIAAIAGMLAGVLLGVGGGGGAGAQAVAMGSVAGARSADLKNSRENEAEADQLGFHYLCASGYPPQDMVNIMQRMCQATWAMGLNIPTYLATHPGLPERVQHLQDMVKEEKEKEKKKKPVQIAYQGDFPIMQAALMAQYSDPNVALDRFQTGAKKGEVAATYGLGRLCLRQGNIKESIPYLQKAASMQPASPFILSTLASAYTADGKLNEAKKVLQTAILLDPSASIVHLRLALVLQELGQKDEALKHLQQIEDLAPMFPEIDYRLGTLLGQMNHEGLAHFYLGRYYEQKRDWDLALFHFKKARAMMRNESPQKMEELEQALKVVEKRKKASYWESGPKKK